MIRPFLLVAFLLGASAAAAADLDARLAEGAALAARGERVAAKALFEQLAAEHPDRPEPLNDLAALAAADGDLERARALLERALATHPSFRAVHENLAAVYAAQAGAAYRKALPIDGATAARPSLVMLTEVAAPRPQVAAVPVPYAPPTVTYAAAPAAGSGSIARAPSGSQPSRAHDPKDAEARAVFAAVDAWAAAWRGRDVERYLAAYAPSFVPPDGLTRAAWSEQRAARIRAPKKIELTLDGRHLTLDQDGARAWMTFRQHYRSDRFSGASRKTLTLIKHEGRWLIAAERTG